MYGNVFFHFRPTEDNIGFFCFFLLCTEHIVGHPCSNKKIIMYSVILYKICAFNGFIICTIKIEICFHVRQNIDI